VPNAHVWPAGPLFSTIDIQGLWHDTLWLCVAGPPLIVTFKKANQSVDFQFNHTPTWEALCKAVEDTFFDLRAEDFILKTGKLRLDADTWPGFASGSKSVTVAVSMQEVFLAVGH
jgi:hypothetical protein